MKEWIGKCNAYFRYLNKFFHSNKILLSLFNFVVTVMLSACAFDANKLTLFVRYLSFALHLSRFSSFIRECIPKFFIYYFHFFLVFVLMIHSLFHSLGGLLHFILLNPSFASLTRSIHLK